VSSKAETPYWENRQCIVCRLYLTPSCFPPGESKNGGPHKVCANCIERAWEIEQQGRNWKDSRCDVDVVSDNANDENAILGCRSWEDIAWDMWKGDEIKRKIIRDKGLRRR